MKTETFERRVWPILEKSDPNVSHERVIDYLEAIQQLPFGPAIIERMLVGQRCEDERLRVRVAGLDLENPLILAAGFDKDGRVVEAMHALGFASVVVGTVMEQPQPGHPWPTIFRPAQGVLLNRMGFPSLGIDQVMRNLTRYGKRTYPLGVSVAASSSPEVIRRLERVADYLVINASSPNTMGLRDLQGEALLREVVQKLKSPLPTLIKVAPDLSWRVLDGIIRVVVEENLAGIVATNTTTNPKIKASLGGNWADVAGGVSGTPLFRRSNEIIRYIYQEAGGCIEIMGVGGVSDLDTLLAKIRAGASAVKLLTGLVYKGPGLPSQLNEELLGFMERYGVRNLAELVGESAL